MLLIGTMVAPRDERWSVLVAIGALFGAVFSVLVSEFCLLARTICVRLPVDVCILTVVTIVCLKGYPVSR